MIDRIHTFLTENGSTRPAEIAREFLKIDAPEGPLVDRLVRGILENEAGFRFSDGAWSATPRSLSPLAAVPFVCLCLVSRKDGSVTGAGAVRIIGGREESSWDRTPGRLLEKRDAVEILRFVGDAAIVGEHGPTLWKFLVTHVTAADIENPGLSLGGLGRSIFPEAGIRSLDDLAQCLGITQTESEDPLVRARFTAEILGAVIERCVEAGVTDLDSLLAFQYAQARGAVDFSRYAFNRDFLRSLPSGPGVYIMEDAEGHCLYVGKARSRKNRLRSYFFPAAGREPRVERLLEALRDIEIRETGSELDALLTEYRLIRDLKPTANTQLEVRGAPPPMHPFLLIQPALGEATVQVYLYNDNRLVVGDISTTAPDASALRSLLDETLAPEDKSAAHTAPEAAIAARYFIRHRENLSYLDLRQVGDPNEAVERATTIVRSFNPAALPVFSV